MAISQLVGTYPLVDYCVIVREIRGPVVVRQIPVYIDVLKHALFSLVYAFQLKIIHLYLFSLRTKNTLLIMLVLHVLIIS